MDCQRGKQFGLEALRTDLWRAANDESEQMIRGFARVVRFVRRFSILGTRVLTL